MARELDQIGKYRTISYEETYEPKTLSIEISQTIEEERNSFLEYDKDTIED